MSETEDRYGVVAGNYDRWVGWEPRLRREMPFLLSSLLPGGTVLDAGCGTGVHARALAAAGFRVTGIDLSPAMLEQARAAESAPGGIPQGVEWIEGDVSDDRSLGDRRFGAVLALGNAVPAMGDRAAMERGLDALIRRTAPGGVLILQYLNGERIRSQGRLVVKGPETVEQDTHGDLDLWLRHHFEAGEALWFSSYTIRRRDGAWSVEGKVHDYHDYPRQEVGPLLGASFAEVAFFDGLSGSPFEPEQSDSLGVRAVGRR